MFDLHISTPLVIALEILLIGTSVALLHSLFLRQRFLIRKIPARLGPVRQGVFLLIYFTDSASILCRTTQGPVIEKLRHRLGNALQVLIIDTTEQPELARLCGIWSVPTTLLINPRGELSHINHGVVRAEKLLMQMHNIELEN